MALPAQWINAVARRLCPYPGCTRSSCQFAATNRQYAICHRQNAAVAPPGFVVQQGHTYIRRSRRDGLVWVMSSLAELISTALPVHKLYAADAQFMPRVTVLFCLPTSIKSLDTSVRPQSWDTLCVKSCQKLCALLTCEFGVGNE